MQRSHLRTVALMGIGALLFGACGQSVTVEKLLSENSDVQTRALEKLKNCSDEKKQTLVPGLIAAVHFTDSQVIDRAVLALKEIGPVAAPSVEKMMTDQDVYARLCALDLLAGYVGPARKDVLPTIIKGLDDPHPLVREETAYYLGRIGSNSPEAVRALKKSLKDTNSDVKAAVEESLKRIDPSFEALSKKSLKSTSKSPVNSSHKTPRNLKT